MDLSGLDLSKAFQIDGNSMDLSGMVNLDLEINMDNMPQMNLGDILTNLDVQVNTDGMQKKCCQVFRKEYQEYVKSHPEADYSILEIRLQRISGLPIRAKGIIREIFERYSEK